MTVTKEKFTDWIDSIPRTDRPEAVDLQQVPTPDATIAIDTRYAVISTGNSSAPPTISAGVIIGTKIARRCYRA